MYSQLLISDVALSLFIFLALCCCSLWTPIHTDTLYIYDLTSMSMHLLNKFGNQFIALLT